MNEPLPSLLTADLDRDGLRDLQNDLAACTKVLRCRVKGHLSSMSQQSELGLKAAFALLEGREVRAVQVEYLHEGQVWIDTLLCGRSTTKLLRSRALRDAQ